MEKYKEWDIETYETNNGEKPIDEFIKKQQPQTIAKVIHNIRLLRQYGNKLGMPHTKMLGSGIYELRVKGKQELRIFYCFKHQTIYLLHVLKKQTQKTPPKELTLAQKRAVEVLT